MGFYSALASYYDRIFPLKNHTFAFIKNRISPRSGPVLDLGCATGSLAIRLSIDRFSVVALETNELLLDRARKKAKKAAARDLRFLHGDMLDCGLLFPPGSFQAILCLGNTLAHVLSPVQIERFMADLQQLLKPGGILTVQLVNFHRILAHDRGRLPTIRRRGIIFTREYLSQPDGPLIEFRSTLVDCGNREKKSQSVMLRPISPETLHENFSRAGFIRVEWSGDFTGADLTPDSPAVIAVAHKKPLQNTAVSGIEENSS